MSDGSRHAQFIPSPAHAGPPPMAPIHDPESTRRRRMRTFLGTLIVGAGVTAGYALMQDQVYQSSATLKVHTQRADTGEGTTMRPSQALLSRPLLGRVLERLPAATQGIDWADARASDSTAALRSMLNVTEATDAGLVELNARGPNKRLLPQIVNAWLDEYIKHEQTDRSTSDEALDSALASERTVLQRRIEAKRDEVEAFKAGHDIQSMQRDENVVSARLRGLTEDLNKAKSRVAEQQGNLQTLRNAIRLGKPVGSQREILSVVQLEKRFVELKEQAIELQSKYTPQYIELNPDMRAVLKQLELVEAELASKKEQVRETALESAAQELASAEETVRRVSLELEQHKEKSEAFSTNFAAYEALRRELDELEALSRDLDQRSLEREVADASEGVAPEVLEYASMPSWPIAPDYSRVAAIGLGATLLVALLAVWMRDFLTRSETHGASYPTVYYSVDARSVPLVQSPTQGAAALGAPNQAVAAITAEPASIPDESISRLIDVAEAPTRLLILLMLSGASAKEAARLRWRNFSAASVRVGRGNEERDLALSAATQDAVGQLRGTADPVAHVWHDAAGAPLAESELDALVVYAAHDAELPNPDAIDTRAIRHTHIGYLLREGADLATIDRVVGYLAPSAKVRYRTLAASSSPVALESIDPVHPAARRADIG